MGGYYGLAVEIRRDELPDADEEGMAVHSVLVQVPQRRPELDPLPLGGAALLQKYSPHVEELMPAFKRLAQLVKPPKGRCRARERKQLNELPEEAGWCSGR